MNRPPRPDPGATNTEAFCAAMRDELASDRSDDGWARGARALVEMYAEIEPRRFETIMVSLATGRPGSAIAEGARWLLVRWPAGL